MEILYVLYADTTKNTNFSIVNDYFAILLIRPKCRESIFGCSECTLRGRSMHCTPWTVHSCFRRSYNKGTGMIHCHDENNNEYITRFLQNIKCVVILVINNINLNTCTTDFVFMHSNKRVGNDFVLFLYITFKCFPKSWRPFSMNLLLFPITVPFIAISLYISNFRSQFK
jgi:hypothetical protein